MAVDGDDILERLIGLPVSTWRYDAIPDALHIGPMAQDWFAAFGFGENDRTIATVDAVGVLVVAVQALHRRVMELENARPRSD